ncbi:hypothetical protein D3C72_1652070 [compost metagenome]
MMPAMLPDWRPSACRISGNGFLSWNWIVLSSSAVSDSVACIRERPIRSFLAQRWMLATASCARTGAPSWNFNPSRSVIFHSSPPFSLVWPAAICGLGRYCSSSP